MKSRIRLIVSAIAVYLTVIAFSTAYGTPAVTVNYNGTGLVPGATINVPIVINTPTGGNWTFFIDYDRNVLTYTGYTEGTHGSGLFGVTPSYLISGLPYLKVGLSYLGGSPGYNYSNTTVATITFTYNGGCTNFSFFNISTGTSTSTETYIKAEPYNVVNTSTVYTGGSVCGSGVVIHSANGGGTWGDASKWDLAVVPNASHDVYITNGNPITIAANAKGHDLTVDAGAQLTLNGATTLMVGGNMAIRSTAANGTGSFVDLGTTTVSGTSTAERYMTGNWDGGTPSASTIFHFISSPVSGATWNTFLNQLLNVYDEPTQSWVNCTLPVTNPLVAGKGYSTALRTNSTISFTGGSFNKGDLLVSGLTKTGSGVSTFQGMNFLGNPYPCALTYDNTWTTSNMNGSIWVWDQSILNYRAHDGSTGTLAGGIIPAEQGFFAQVSSGSGSVTIPNAKRTHSTQAFYKTAIANEIYLTATGNGYGDEMIVFFDQNASAAYDPALDAYKLFGDNAAPQLYSILEDNTDATINALPSMSLNNSVNLGFKVGATGAYSITASELSSFQSGTIIYLEDKQDSKMVNLMDNPTYSFNANAGDPEQRFTLHFNPVGVPTITEKAVRIYSNDKTIFVNIPSSMQGTIHVYDLIGNEIAQKSVVGNALNKISLSNPSGYYFVKVIGDSGTTSGKVFIQ
jgi:hypothetical protein